jgi:hypothetical protein
LHQATSRRAVFGPSDIEKLSTAYQAALTTLARRQPGLRSGLTEHIRHQVAAVIMAEAGQGECDPERLWRAALRSVGEGLQAAHQGTLAWRELAESGQSEPTPDDADVVARAKQNFLARNCGHRAWDCEAASLAPDHRGGVLPLSAQERSEFVEQARHELTVASSSASPDRAELRFNCGFRPPAT